MMAVFPIYPQSMPKHKGNSYRPIGFSLRHVGIYNHTSKISQVFMGPAIECTTDAWWDAKERCIVTKADAELDDLMNQDVDLTFPEDEVTINLTQVQEVL